MKVNIEGDISVNDPYYRYKMDKVVVVKLKTKTQIMNLDVIAKQLDRDVKLIVNWFKLCFHCNITYKNGETTTFTKLEQIHVEKALRQFIEKFVLCKQCRLPETVLYTDNSCMYTDCKACGKHDKIIKN